MTGSSNPGGPPRTSWSSARRCNRPDWVAAAALYAEYRDVLDLRMPEAFDPAGIITAARQIFQDEPDFLAAERDRLQLVLVDDMQEANPAVFELLADIAAGKDVLITSSPDTVVQGFRGARPDLVAELPRLLPPPAAPSWNGRSGPRTATPRPSRRPGSPWPGGSPAAPAGSPRGGSNSRRPSADCRVTAGRAGATAATDAAACRRRRSRGTVEAHLLPSPVHELRYVAQRILEAQLNDGRELGDIAVIVRNGGQLSQLQRYLAGQGIPVRIPVAESAVRDEVAVRPLLDAYAVALDPAVLTPEAAVSC